MPIKVLIIDDSALVRETLSSILNSDSDIKVIATASDPIFGVKKIKVERPDVIILDIEMARMDGLTFLKKMNETLGSLHIFPIFAVRIAIPSLFLTNLANEKNYKK